MFVDVREGDGQGDYDALQEVQVEDDGLQVEGGAELLLIFILFLVLWIMLLFVLFYLCLHFLSIFYI